MTTRGDRGDALSRRLQLGMQRHADLPAVQGRHATLTYRELDQQASVLARHLQAAGVRCGQRVPLFMHRSPQLVVAQCALLRLGAAYAPVDLTSPPARQEAMLRALDPALILSHGTPAVPDVGARVLDVLSLPAPARSDDLLPWTTPPDTVPAYVMFTSGTTGTPKGVMVPRGGIARLVCDADFAQFRSGSRWAFLSSPAFDASTLEVWAPLLNGGCCVVQEEPLPSLDELADFVLAQRISDAWLTAALFNALVEDRLDAFAGLRQLFTGGERVSPHHARTVLDAYPTLRLVNGYGPTENTTFTLCHAVTPADTDSAAGIPIGRPIRGTVVRIAGDSPQADSGELLAGGDGVALGYVNDAELSARKFVHIDGQRWYRTGDLVRRRHDGVFEFCGRVDRQVKIQGHRVELDEVESVLLSCPGITAAAVLVRGDTAESRHLAACFSREAGAAPGVQPLAQYLSERLPPSAVPKLLLPMERLPLNLNGKLDRVALASWVEQAVRHTGEPATPEWHTETERLLGAIWQQCLRTRHVHRHSSFWDLGGTSLLALQVSAQVRRTLHRHLTPIDVLGVPILAEQAQHIDAAPLLPAEEWPEAAAERRLTLTQGQQALLEASQLDATGCAYLVHTALHIVPAPDDALLRQAFKALAQHHPMLRVSVDVARTPGEARVNDGLAAAWWSQHEALEGLPASSEWPSTLLALINRPLDVSRGVMRVDVWPLPGGSCLAVWTVHHVAVDEASIDRCLQQLHELLQGSPLAATYGRVSRFADVERAWTDSRAAGDWATTLVEALRGQRLPLARAPGAGREAAFDIPRPAAARLLACCEQWKQTPFAPLLVAYGLALQEVFGPAWRFAVTPFSRRIEPELIEPVGYWLDMAWIEAGAREGETVGETLARVSQAVLDQQRASFVPQRALSETVARQDPDVARRLNAFGFTWRIEPLRELAFGAQRATLLNVPQQAARYGVCLHASLLDGTLRCSIEAVENAFAAGHVEALTGAFVRALERVTQVERLPAYAAPQAAPSATPVDRELEGLLRRAWQQWLGVDAADVPASSDFLRSGGNSLTVMRMAAQLRRQHGLRIDAGAFLAHPTFARLCELASVTSAQVAGDCVFIGAPDAQKILLLIPGRGGRALGLYKLGGLLQARLGDDHAIAIMDLEAMLQHVPHEEGPLEFLYRRMAQLLEELGPQRIEGIVGFSLGGLLALRLARQFVRAPAPPVWLLDSYAPRMMAASLSRRIERRLARWMRLARQAPALDAVAAEESMDPSPELSSPRAEAQWDAIQAALAGESVDDRQLEVHLVQARQSLDHVGLLWRRSTNGFNPGRHAKWYVHRLDAMHLDLPRALAADTAALFESGLRWSSVPASA